MPRVNEVLKFKDGGPTLEQARAAMMAAGEAPRGFNASAAPAATAAVVAAADGSEPPVLVEGDEGFVAELPATPVVEPTAEPAAPPAPAPVSAPPASAPEPATFEIDNQHFKGRIWHGSGAEPWTAEIKYKLNGSSPRPEIFKAGSKNALMLKLLEGKAHGTLRVRTAVRREKLGRDLDKAWPLDDMTVDEFQALPEKTQKGILRNIGVAQALEFRLQHPEFLNTESNGRMIVKFLDDKNLPQTIRNLEFAYDELSEEGLLETRSHDDDEIEAPVATPVVAAVSAPTPQSSAYQETAPVAVNPAPAAAAATPPSGAQAPQPGAVVVRKRASSGLQPGQSSTPSGGLEEGAGPRELSEADARKMPLSELRRIVTTARGQRAGVSRS